MLDDTMAEPCPVCGTSIDCTEVTCSFCKSDLIGGLDRNCDIAIKYYIKAGVNGLTDDEALAAELLHQNSWRSTRLKLIEEGRVEETGEQRMTRAGYLAQVYRYC